MDEFLIASRLVHFAATMLLFGASLFRLYAEAGAPPRLLEAFDRWLRNILLVVAFIASLSALAWWDALAVYMGDGWADALNPDTLGAVLFETEFGKIWLWHLGLCATLLAVILISRRWSSKSNLLVLILSFSLLISFAGVGHAMMHEGSMRTLHQASQVVHLTAAAAWLGALVPLGYVMQKASRAPASDWTRFALLTLPRFSRTGYFAVGLILLSGCVMAWHMIASLSDLFGTIYGRLLLTKVCLFLLMTGIALFNRLWLMPAVNASKESKRKPGSLRLLSRNVVIEQIIGLAALVAASVLGTLQP
jgi:copper resistance protein D